jgi:hypothetical protein
MQQRSVYCKYVRYKDKTAPKFHKLMSLNKTCWWKKYELCINVIQGRKYYHYSLWQTNKHEARSFEQKCYNSLSSAACGPWVLKSLVTCQHGPTVSYLFSQQPLSKLTFRQKTKTSLHVNKFSKNVQNSQAEFSMQ